MALVPGEPATIMQFKLVVQVDKLEQSDALRSQEEQRAEGSLTMSESRMFSWCF